ncbi:MAG: CHAT domain-containing protein [Acidobacteria bacterium]|nr:CHAT domain-containing protein [Acidobacteriota bacterium]
MNVLYLLIFIFFSGATNFVRSYIGRIAFLCLCYLAVGLVFDQRVVAQINFEPLTNNEKRIVDEILFLSKNGIDELSMYIVKNKNNIDRKIIKDLIFKARLRESGSYPEKSLEIFNIALFVSHSLNDKRYIALIHFFLGRVLFKQSKVDEAIQNYLVSEKQFYDNGYFADLVYVYADIGYVYLKKDVVLSKMYFEKGLIFSRHSMNSTLPNIYPIELGLASLYSGLAALSLIDGDRYRAIGYYHDALASYRVLDGVYRSYGIQISEHLFWLGRLYREVGSIVKSLIYYHESYKFALRGNNRLLQAEIFNSIGVLYLEQEFYVKAEKYFFDSLDIYSSDVKLYGKEIVLLNLGVVYQRKNDKSLAERYFKEAYQKAKEQGNKDVMIAAGEGLGVCFRIAGDFKSAMTILDASLVLANEIKDKIRIAEVLWRKSEVLHDMKQFDDSIELATQSLHISKRLQLTNLSVLTSTLLARSMIKKNEIDLAIGILKQAIAIVEERRYQVAGQEQGRQLYFENKLAPYHLMINIYVEKGMMHDALTQMENIKGRILLDSLKKSGGRITYDMTDMDRLEEQKLNQVIVDLNKLLRAEIQKKYQDQNRINRVRGELINARLKHSIYQDLLQATNPGISFHDDIAKQFIYYDFKLAGLDADTLYVGYTVTEELTYTFVISPRDGEEEHNLVIQPIEIRRTDLRKKISYFHAQLAQRSLNYTVASRDLYDLLIKPIEIKLIGKRKICIIPDDVLWGIPFQALTARSGRYLIEEYSVFYAPSLSVYLQMLNRYSYTGESKENSLLAFGNPSLDDDTVEYFNGQQRGENFKPLPHAEFEVKAILTMFRNPKSKALIGLEAEERLFKSMVSEYRTIHLATHGVLDDQNPLYSYLLLSKKDDDQIEDGILEAREILNLDLSADMVVLSACETARGRIGSGEGLIGMSWAFFIAGCRSTVVSQWKIDSAGTAKFMIEFYKVLERNRVEGKSSKSEALKNAAIMMMKNIRYRHPYYWAGFVTIGLDN